MQCDTMVPVQGIAKSGAAVLRLVILVLVRSVPNLAHINTILFIALEEEEDFA